ncbi:MAG: hypothetical protein Q9162_000393 [Coniocarpon cinnabarinum]
MASTTGRKQPSWTHPSPRRREQEPKLRIYNSLTQSKNPFVPIDTDGSKITWYACGPTVYDDSHIGHARNYVSTDIIRRILTDYFHYHVRFVMNITDVDDKIIVKAREEKLFSDFRSSATPQKARATVQEAFFEFLKKKFPNYVYDERSFADDLQRYYENHVAALEASGKPLTDNEAKMKRDVRILTKAYLALRADTSSGEVHQGFWTQTQDIVKPFLDKSLGSTFNQDDHAPFNAISRKYEARFFEDMDQLNVRRPDLLTRVTEYGEPIVQFIQRVVDNGFAYEIDGSVYFSIDKFERAGCPYARLQPWNRGDAELQADGEGALSKGTGKRSDADFALWKASKPGEPAWPSPWGKGRPGWHIECSAMASRELGQAIDIHSGGIDLAFPHHDNELAQSEAYWHMHPEKKSECGDQWINYFMHMGHLHIGGHKMSKSLKNFTTIREDLKTRSPRAMRLTFLMGNWSSPMEITEGMLKEVSSWEKTITNFFLKAKDVERRIAMSDGTAAIASANESSEGSVRLMSALAKAKKDTDEALADSFDTPRVMRAIIELITQYNSAEKSSLSTTSTLEVAQWVTHMINIFGLNATGGGAPDTTVKTIGWAGLDIPSAMSSNVYAIADFRDELRVRANRAMKDRKTGATLSNGSANQMSAEAVRQLADRMRQTASQSDASSKVIVERTESVAKALSVANADVVEYLKLCDKIRDEWLWDLGVYLEDSNEEGQPAIVRPLDRELVDARQQADQRKQEKLEQDQKKQVEKARKEAEMEAKAKIDPTQMFRSEERKGEFSAWDEQGIPAKLADGSDLPKNKAKGLKKEWEQQKKRYDQWREKQKGGA